MKVTNLRNGKELSNNVAEADSLFKRMKGLIGKTEMKAGEALLIKPCMSIHTFFMRFPIDVLFLNRRNKVIGLKKNLQPNRLTRIYFSAVSVLELPAGTLKGIDTRVGDEIEIA